MLLRPAETTPGLRVKPRLRGLSHEIAFFLVLPLGAALIFEVDTPRGRVSAIVFAASVAAMFGASGLSLPASTQRSPSMSLPKH